LSPNQTRDAQITKSPVGRTGENSWQSCYDGGMVSARGERLRLPAEPSVRLLGSDPRPSGLPEVNHPKGFLDTGRASLAVWRGRKERKPCLFGHGLRFMTVKWPIWYDAHAVLDTLGRFPALWSGAGARTEDRDGRAGARQAKVPRETGGGG
jgi:hypothetical protein